MIGCCSHEPWCVLNRCGETAFASCRVLRTLVKRIVGPGEDRMFNRRKFLQTSGAGAATGHWALTDRLRAELFAASQQAPTAGLDLLVPRPAHLRSDAGGISTSGTLAFS